MDETRFDRCARSLAGGASRRSLLTRALIGLAIPAALARFDPHDAAARPRRKSKVTLCQSGQTVKVSKQARKKLLREGATVGACQAVCVPNCANRSCGSDGCGGSCGTCEAGQTCTDGDCQIACPSGQVACFGACIPEGCEANCGRSCDFSGGPCCGPLFCQASRPGQFPRCLPV